MDILILRGTDLWLHPATAASMFSDRKKQFGDRLGWPVKVDGQGYERDQYDPQNPLYVILCGRNGQHAGSMRLLPTTGQTMMNDHFLEVTNAGAIRDRRIWECTRFCLSPGEKHRTAATLLFAGAKVMQEIGLKGFAGVFDRKMIRLYAALGVTPKILGSHNYGSGDVYGGFWSFDPKQFKVLARKSLLDPHLVELRLANAILPKLRHEMPA